MPDAGYRGSLFDASGPQKYAEALGQVSSQMTKVSNSFEALGSKSTTSLTEMGRQFDALITKAGQFKSLVSSTGGKVKSTQGGQASDWSNPAAPNAGSTGGQQADTMNIGGDHGPAAPQSSRMTRAPVGGVQDPPSSPTTQSSPSRMFDPGTPSGAALAVGSYATGAASRWMAANQGPMMESSILGQQYANWYGGGRGDYQTIPMVSGTPGMGGRGTEAFTQGGAGDYYKAQQILNTQMGVRPQGQGRPSNPNASMMGQVLNTAMLSDPGLKRAEAAQAFAPMYSGASTQRMASIGISVRQNGVMADPNKIFEQIFQKTYPSAQLQSILTQDDILNALTPGAPLEKNFEAAGLDPNSETFTLFSNYVKGRTSWAAKPENKVAASTGKLPTTGSDMQKQFGLDQGPAAAKIKKDSRIAQAKSQVYPSASTSAEHLDNAATKLLKVAEQLGGSNTKVGKNLIGEVGQGLSWASKLGGGIGSAFSLASAALPFIEKAAGGGGGPGAGVNDIAATPEWASKIVSQAKSAVPAGTAAEASAGASQGAQVATLTSLLATASRPTAAGTFDWYGTLVGKTGGAGGGAGVPDFQKIDLASYQSNNGGDASSAGTGDGTGGTGSADPRDAGLAGLGVGTGTTDTAGTVGSTPDGGYTPTTFAQALLAGLGAPATAANVASLVNWFKREGGAGPQWGIKNNVDNYNPLNTTLAAPGAKSTNGPGVKSYLSWAQGLQATIDTFKSKRYSDLVAAFKSGGGLGNGHYASLGTWSGGAYDHIARGSYNIEATKVALLHAGERVIPAADNFTIADRYQRLTNDGGGGTTHYHLNFQAQSVQLVVAPGTRDSDMATIAQKFMDSVSKPQIIQSVRSS